MRYKIERRILVNDGVIAALFFPIDRQGYRISNGYHFHSDSDRRLCRLNFGQWVTVSINLKGLNGGNDGDVIRIVFRRQKLEGFELCDGHLQIAGRTIDEGWPVGEDNRYWISGCFPKLSVVVLPIEQPR